MERFGQEKISSAETGTRNERIEKAEIRVREMFGAEMETPGIVVERIEEDPSFSGPEERSF